MVDKPDYVSTITVYHEGGFAGLEELAARLGSIVPFDLQGNVILMENFESEETEWTDASSGGTCTATRTSRHKWSGDWAAKLYNSGGAGNKAILERYFHFPGLLKYAAFCRFAWDSDCRKVVFRIELADESNTYNIEVAYDLPTKTLTVRTTDDTDYEVDDDLTLSEDVVTWYPILVTFDLDTGYYDKLYFADREYDISSVEVDTSGLPFSNHGYVAVGALLGNIIAYTAYVDDIIIAKNVP